MFKSISLSLVFLFLTFAPALSYAQYYPGMTYGYTWWTVGRIIACVLAVVAAILLFLVCMRMMRRRNNPWYKPNFFNTGAQQPPLVYQGQQPYGAPPSQPYGGYEQYPMQYGPPAYNPKDSNAMAGAQSPQQQNQYQPPPGPPPPPPAHVADSDRFVGGFRNEPY